MQQQQQDSITAATAQPMQADAIEADYMARTITLHENYAAERLFRFTEACAAQARREGVASYLSDDEAYQQASASVARLLASATWASVRSLRIANQAGQVAYLTQARRF